MRGFFFWSRCTHDHSANDRRKTYVGNGVATAFPGPRAFLASHIQVFTGTHPVYSLVPPSQYTVTGLRAIPARSPSTPRLH
ncbi:hypothetical protein VM57_15345 [Stenotrophomonas maltophilia]|uniref:Uncharacterized protein n=1 Tax=Stenotrophomonas maltophilia TaxID=40324 RepID=A0A0F5ZPT6_STEMA|nr:hypothetical protein VM57_15345 [Stenotrophomonas maltophilia]